MPKVCLIIIDGLRYDTALAECGYLMAAVEAGQARLWQMRACLPSISAPLYETIHTGLAPIDHDILSNEALTQSARPNVFSELKTAGKVTGAVAHAFFHTLYGGCDFDAFDHIEITDPSAPVPYARYYSMAGYRAANTTQPSEVDLCAQAWVLARDHAPDYLLLHSSSCDTLGHAFTGEGKEYRRQAALVDGALSELIPRLRERGYDVLVTADHGINADGEHGGDQAVLRDVPFFAFSDGVKSSHDAPLDQRTLAPTILSLIGVPVPATMQVAAIV